MVYQGKTQINESLRLKRLLFLKYLNRKFDISFPNIFPHMMGSNDTGP